MLSAYSATVVAYVTDGEIICRECALDRYGELEVNMVDTGIDDSLSELSPLCRYDLDSIERDDDYKETCGRCLRELDY